MKDALLPEGNMYAGGACMHILMEEREGNIN